MHHNGFKMPSHPVLEPIETIRCQDAILDLSDPQHPKEPEWPEAEFIVGNPPFLGGKLLRTNLGDEYVDQMFRVWERRVPREADLCCYWFEKARAHIQGSRCGRAGLLATQGIRGGANRKVVQRIKESGDIFFAESDRDWVLAGATVHVSMIGFDNGAEKQRLLDGKPAKQIHSNLRAAADTTSARPIRANLGLSFMGDTKGGAFDIVETLALEMLRAPNAHGRPNSDVVVPWVNGLDITRRPRDMWIIDFGPEMPVEEAARYEAPFRYLDSHVRPEREKNNRESYRERWWIHVEARPALRGVLCPLARFLVTVGVAKHRLFCWMQGPTLPDHALFVFSRTENWFFGVLHSRVHEVWARAQGTQVRERESGFRYTPTTCFETFPFPECMGGVGRPGESTQYEVGSTESGGGSAGAEVVERNPTLAAIAAAARELDDLRKAWLNPPEWTTAEVLEFPGSVDGPWARYIDPATVRPVPGPHPDPLPAGEGTAERASGPHPDPLPAGEGTAETPSAVPRPPSAVGIVRWPRIVPKDADCAESLKKRTLTNLYNQRPEWLRLAHEKLDAAVFAAYGWESGISDEALLEKLLALNLERAARQG